MQVRLYIQFFFLAAFTGQAFAQAELTDAELDYSADWLAKTSAASPGEDILIAAMFAQQNQPDRAPEFLSMPVASPEHSRLRYSLIAHLCLPVPIAAICEESRFDSRLVALDSNNLEPYLYSMLRLVGLQSNDAALSALAKGNTAPQMNNYYFEKVALLRSRLATSGYPRQQINGTAETLAGAGRAYALYSEILRVCADKSKTDADWKTQCITLGERLEREGMTAIQNVFGFAIQRDSLGSSNVDEEQRAEVLARRDAFNAIRDRGSRELAWWNDVSLKTNDLYRRMIDLGEINAVLEELQPLKDPL